MLGLAAFLGYQVAIGNSVQLNEYRGEFNSAWVGSLMSLVTTFFLGWFAFYLVKGSVTRDRKTGVGQMAKQLFSAACHGHRIGIGFHTDSIAGQGTCRINSAMESTAGNVLHGRRYR